MDYRIKQFFSYSDSLDYLSLRQLSHLSLNWELSWYAENEKYVCEVNSFAGLLNNFFDEMARTIPPVKYHDNEDVLVNYLIKKSKWPIRKEGYRWVGDNYESILEQGGFDDLDEYNLVQAATGREIAAINLGQKRFDDMEEGHQKILAGVIAIILYHRGHLSNR